MALQIKNLSTRYDGKPIIKNVSFTVERGEILGIFGLVGAGKSTLIRSVAGLIDDTDGKIQFEAADLTTVPCEERGFHFPDVSNQAFWKETFKTKDASQLADGEGQVLALVDALEKAEDVVLLDNQFCFMDKKTREVNCEKLRQAVREKNLSVIFATNNYEEIFSICDRVAILHDGEIRQIGTPSEIYRNPNSAIVADVTGKNNLIRAKLVSNKNAENPEFQTIEGEHRLFTDKTEQELSALSGKIVTLAIRPEHISISFGASFPEDNLLRAEITSVIFQGSTTTIQLSAGGLELEALVLRLVGLKVGEECMVGLPPDRISVLID